MNINLDNAFTNLEGETLTKDGTAPLTLRHVMATSLSMARCEMEATKAWGLAKEIMGLEQEWIDIPIEDVAKIKQAIAAHNWVPMVIAQAYNYLEGKA